MWWETKQLSFKAIVEPTVGSMSTAKEELITPWCTLDKSLIMLHHWGIAKSFLTFMVDPMESSAQ